MIKEQIEKIFNIPDITPNDYISVGMTHFCTNTNEILTQATFLLSDHDFFEDQLFTILQKNNKDLEKGLNFKIKNFYVKDFFKDLFRHYRNTDSIHFNETDITACSENKVFRKRNNKIILTPFMDRDSYDYDKEQAKLSINEAYEQSIELIAHHFDINVNLVVFLAQNSKSSHKNKNMAMDLITTVENYLNETEED